MKSKRYIDSYIKSQLDSSDSVLKFLSLFNQIDKYFDKILNTDAFLPYNEKIKRIITGNYYISWFVKLHQFQLKYLGEIRNQITHGIEMDGHTYIQPTEYAIKYLEKYVHDIKKPPRCIDIFTKKVFTCKYDDNLKSIIKIMEDHNYSHVPVYNNLGKFVGLLSESNILTWLAEDNIHDICSAKVGDIKLINSKDYVYFISSKVNVYEVDKLFAEKKVNNESIGILLITENGKRDEPLLGIISAGDTAVIDSYVVH